MWPFRNIVNWKRVDFDPPLDKDKQIRRNKAKEDADHDLRKPVQQFLCDVHEEANRPPCEKSTNKQLTYAEDRILDAIDKLSCENKRIVALQTVTAHASARTANWIKWLTFVLVILTLFLVAQNVSFDANGLHWGKSIGEQGRNNKSNNHINENTRQKEKQKEPKPAQGVPEP